MRKELRAEVKRLAKSHIPSAVEERVLPEAMDLMHEWAGETIRKVSVDMADREVEQVMDALVDSYFQESIKQLQAWVKKYRQK